VRVPLTAAEHGQLPAAVLVGCSVVALFFCFRPGLALGGAFSACVPLRPALNPIHHNRLPVFMSIWLVSAGGCRDPHPDWDQGKWYIHG
jgi:hypothetical protein